MSNASLSEEFLPALTASSGSGTSMASAGASSGRFPLSDRQLAFAFAALLALGTLAIHRVNQRSYIGYHGLTHSAITFSVLAGNIPPTNPFAAQLPLPYYWGYHVVLAKIVQITGMTPVAVAEILNVLTIFALGLLFASLGRWLLGSVKAGMLAVVLILFAMNPFGPLLMAYRMYQGMLGVGIDEFTRSPTHPMLRAMFPNLDIRWAGTFFFHMQPSSRPLAMLAGAVTAALVCRSFTRVSILRGTLIALATATACAMQPIVGVGTAFGLGVGLLFVRFANRVHRTMTNAVFTAIIASMGVGVLLAYPTYQQLLNGNLVGLPIEKSASVIAAKAFHVFAMLAIVPLFLTWLAFRRGYLARPQLQMLAVGGVALIATSWITNVPGHREHSFFNMGTYLLALPAAASCGMGWRRKSAMHSQDQHRTATRRLFRLCAAILPVMFIMILAFGYRRPIALAHRGDLVRYPARADAMAVYDWIEANTPTDAVIMFDTRDGEQISFYSVESEIPAMTKRFLFIDVVEWFIPQGHPEVPARQDIVAAIFDGQALTQAQVHRVEELNVPIYALTRDPEESETLSKQFGASRFEQGKYAVYKVGNLSGSN